MNDNKLFSVSQFVIAFFKRRGALVEEKGYALWEVLLPDDLISYFVADHLLLAFDYEIAEENPGSVFVTAGSSFLDTVISLAADYGRYTVHYWPKKNVVLSKNIESKINQFVSFQRCQPPVVTLHWLADNIYYGFFFRVAYSAYEKTEEIISVVINGWNGFPVMDFHECVKNFMMSGEQVSRFTDIPFRSIKELYQSACRETENMVKERALIVQKSANSLLEKEIDKINRYYRSLIEEKQIKLKITNDTQKTERLKKQLKAIEGEYQRRRDDTAARYQVEAEVSLDHMMAWQIPCELIRIEMKHKNATIKETLLYSPVTGKVENPACRQCGQPSPILEPDKSAELCCPACLGRGS